MLDTMTSRRPGFRPGRSLHLADGRDWSIPSPIANAEPGSPYESLLSAIITADSRSELLRAELALGIHLIGMNYELAPLTMGSLLDFPSGSPGLDRLQGELHDAAIEHIRAYRPASDDLIADRPIPRIARRFGLFSRVRASISA